MVIRHGMRGSTPSSSKKLEKMIGCFTGLKVLKRGREMNTGDRRRKRWKVAQEKGVEHGS